jgi:hypothetical protein
MNNSINYWYQKYFQEKKNDNMIDKEHILSKIERIVNRRLNLLQGEYFNLEEETKGMTNELVDILCSIEPTIEALRTEYEKGRADVIGKTLEWINVFNDYNYIMQYSDSCEHPINEIIEWYKNYINRE